MKLSDAIRRIEDMPAKGYDIQRALNMDGVNLAMVRFKMDTLTKLTESCQRMQNFQEGMDLVIVPADETAAPISFTHRMAVGTVLNFGKTAKKPKYREVVLFGYQHRRQARQKVILFIRDATQLIVARADFEWKAEMAEAKRRLERLANLAATGGIEVLMGMGSCPPTMLPEPSERPWDSDRSSTERAAKAMDRANFIEEVEPPVSALKNLTPLHFMTSDDVFLMPVRQIDREGGYLFGPV